jgi:CDP-paratose 2-epimerase
MTKYCIITGSSGLVGSEAVKFFCAKNFNVIGIDNDMRLYFFGTSTVSINEQLVKDYDNFQSYSIDIRNKDALESIFKKYNNDIECIIHCAAQPSHDWAAKEPHTDFGINAVATLNLLELTRQYCKAASFIFMSTNKVYGDTPNRLPVEEYEKRYDIVDYAIDETMSIDQCKHSIFGASKLAADIMVQEYGRYFDMNTVVFRGGCITGPNHKGAELHGFLSYLVKCINEDKEYTIYGYKGKQVRDNIHSYDLVYAFWCYHNKPIPGAVYNIGGGRDNSLSIMEAIEKINNKLGKSWSNYIYNDTSRSGDHIWYISNLDKFKNDYPEWSIKYSIDNIIRELISRLQNDYTFNGIK